MQGLYNAGYNSRIDAGNANKDRRVQLMDQLFIKAGSWVVDRYKQNHAELKGLKTLGRASNSQIQMEVEKLGAQLTPAMQASLNLYKQEYDKGARMSVRGMSKKRKEEGQIMMDMAFHKMQTMKKGLNVVQDKMKEHVDNGMIELGEKGFNSTGVTGWNPGATEEEFNNAVRLATGDMLGNLSIDDETGEIYYMSQIEADVDEEAYGEYVKEMGGTQGTHEEYVEAMQAERKDNQILNPEEWSKQNEGILSHKEWAELNQENPNIDAKLFSRVEFPGEKDDVLQDGYMDLLTKHEQTGLDGFSVDQESSERLKMELHDSYSNATDTQIRSFLFGGQVTAVIDGKLVRVTPAQKLLIDSGINPGKDGGTEVEQAQFFSFQQALEELKGEDFSKGSPRREELVDMVTESVEGYQTNAHGKYLDKEEKANVERANSGKGDESDQYGTWDDDGTTGKRYVNKEWMFPTDFKRKVQPTIDALNSSEENISELNTQNGTAIKKENGTWYWWNKSGGDGSGSWVESNRNYIARGNNVTSYLTGVKEVSGGKNVELQPTQKNALNNMEKNYPIGDTEVAYNKDTYAIVPAIGGANEGEMVAVTKKEFYLLMGQHVKNKDYVKQLASSKNDFANFKYNLKRALKGETRALTNLNLIE